MSDRRIHSSLENEIVDLEDFADSVEYGHGHGSVVWYAMVRCVVV